MNAPIHGDARATAVGFVAIFIWGLAALSVELTRNLPPFEMLTIGFALGSGLLFAWGRLATGDFCFLRQPWHYYVAATLLVFINNICFVMGLRLAPIVAASLINYLWPLLIILLSVPVLRRPLHWWHMGGALLGFGGCAWLLLGGDAAYAFSTAYAAGYALAFMAALSFSLYSLMLRRFYAAVPTPALGPVFAGVAVLSALTLPMGYLLPGSFAIDWRLPQGLEIVALILVGAGTLMLAFACWDYGAKKGDVRVMGAGSYLTPLLSVMALAALGNMEVEPSAWLACLLIIAGAFLGSAREIFGSNIIHS